MDDSSRPTAPHSKERVSYFYNLQASTESYGEGHPMKPARLGLTHELVIGYGLHNYMNIYTPWPASTTQIEAFHSTDYVDALKRVTPNNYDKMAASIKRFGLGEDDCPVFSDMWDYFRMSCGGSIMAANYLGSGASDMAINWMGGLHHAKKSVASGFCYTNDIVLGILELLRYYQRVLYIDLDVHHGDGVQDAFYGSNRVMTLSIHAYDGAFFPGTGSLDESGIGRGKNYAVNVPLQMGIDDASYHWIFKEVARNVIDKFQPSAIVLQCGADSLAGDRLGSFNVSIKGHGECVRFIKSFGIPTMVLGGGGYTIRNVARCWAYETSVCCGVTVPNELPETVSYDYYGPDFVLHPNLTSPDRYSPNTRASLEKIRHRIVEQLRHVESAPSVQIHQIPPSFAQFNHLDGEWAVDFREDVQPDHRLRAEEFPVHRWKNSKTVDDNEFYDPF
ncbi:hypothetical protein CXG81DRAFT_16007 [Caulochytrium protostelioides]|uniref:Histone deacetylase n=1 Tax=Caulochytrium protostelioides TaxID=1555241 RepID=A0A4P9WY59_9FUNG|nr:histone deacetylase [Caulochytrium protostelioides]RKO98364.1 hypothetical protein CXG81DRAFT_16007 [Caulochytrium protostelioides]|eukprot:RKO98364.1 hypothetical protein CXG81DRAFT_16007 [Caulochytrium protostelioides]